jgi:hypothetical protein
MVRSTTDAMQVAAEGIKHTATLTVFNIENTIPTKIPEIFSELAEWAIERAACPHNHIDDNPYIIHLWAAVSAVLSHAAKDLESRIEDILALGPPSR